MRPILLEFQCFGPYMEPQSIDFERLEKNGILLISGDTGVGKTTILDGICCALYGEASGGRAKDGGRGEFAAMRCKLAGSTDITKLAYVFEAGGNRYRFERSIRVPRKNLIEEQDCKIWKDGGYVPLLANPKKNAVNEQAEQILGLTCDQFRQVIMLPQGKFEQLLVSDSANKQAILESLFQAERWKAITDRVYEAANEQSRELHRREEMIRFRLEQQGCDTVEALDEQIQQRTQRLDRLQQERVQVETAYREKEESYQAGLAVVEKYRQLERYQEQIEKLEAQADWIVGEKQRLQQMREADSLREDYQNRKDAEKKRDQLQAEKNAKEADQKRAEQELLKVQKQWEVHERQAETMTGLTEELSVCRSRRDSYQRLEERQQVLWEQETITKRLEAEHQKKEAAYQKNVENYNLAYTAAGEAAAAFTGAQKRYLQGIGVVLAEKLEEGVPCPVCGSTSHPKPATGEGASVTEMELEALEAKKDQAEAKERQLRKQLQEQERLQREAKEQCEEQRRRLEKIQTEYDELKKQKLADIQTLEELDARICLLKKQQEDYEQEQQELQRQEQQARERRDTVIGVLTTIVQQYQEQNLRYEEADRRWQQIFGQSAFREEEAFRSCLRDREEQEKVVQEITRYQTELRTTQQAYEEQKRSLEQIQKPDIQEEKRTLDQMKLHLEAMQRQQTIEEQEQKKAQTEAEELRRQEAACIKERQLAEANLVFAKRLRGDTGIGLQRYVLGVMLSYITVEANRLLRLVHGGRYQLYRMDETAGTAHKKGLELGVYDSRTNERRSVNTLSGGERFLASLCLAIGLTTVVQAQGSHRLGAMFIDEGFGTLDEESIRDALEVLQHVQQNQGLVVLISHHERLKETILNRLEVRAGKTGSRVLILS